MKSSFVSKTGTADFVCVADRPGTICCKDTTNNDAEPYDLKCKYNHISELFGTEGERNEVMNMNFQ